MFSIRYDNNVDVCTVRLDNDRNDMCSEILEYLYTLIIVLLLYKMFFRPRLKVNEIY